MFRRNITCKTDDIECHLTDTDEDVRAQCSVLGRDLVAPILAELEISTAVLAKLNYNTEHHKLSNVLTRVAFSRKISVNSRICAGPNAGF